MEKIYNMYRNVFQKFTRIGYYQHSLIPVNVSFNDTTKLSHFI